MDETVKHGFFTDRSKLNLEDYLIFDYYFESTIDPEEAAAHLCQEQSTAQWKRVDVDEDLREEFGAKVIELLVERELDKPSYPLLAPAGLKSYGCRIKIAHPHRNFGPKLPNLLSAACGEGTFFSKGIAAIKLFDIEFPDRFLHHFEGPQFGIDGIREILDIHDRPLFFGVIKPNLGLSPESSAELAYQGWLGGLDIAKDDEMLADVAWSPLQERARLLGRARIQSEKETGQKKIYLANITDEVDRLIELHDIAVAGGANAVLVNGMTTGLSAVRMLRKHAQVPLVGHLPFIAAFTRAPYLGVHSKVITKLQRLVGFDAVIMPGFGNRMKTPENEVLRNIQECFKPLGHLKKTLPVPAGSQWAGSTPMIYAKLKTADFGIVPGRGVFNHPMGPKAGAASLRQAWEAFQQGLTLEEYSRNHPELRAAVDTFGLS
jgi:ribulose-bisphosphate carboxylase large chain